MFELSNKISKDSRENVNCFRLRLSSEKLTLDLYKYLYKDCGEYSDNYLSRKKEKNFSTITTTTNNK